MPEAEETQEFARAPNSNFVLLSQMSDSQLIKIELDPTTKEPIAFQSFPTKGSPCRLHGVWLSKIYLGMTWLSIQGDNQLLLVLVGPGQNLTTAPSIIHTIDMPAPGNVLHCVFEIGKRVWASLKEKSKQTGQHYVFSADVFNPTDQILYPCLASPVFIKEELIASLIYVTQDWLKLRIPTDSCAMLIHAVIAVQSGAAGW